MRKGFFILLAFLLTSATLTGCVTRNDSSTNASTTPITTNSIESIAPTTPSSTPPSNPATSSEAVESEAPIFYGVRLVDKSGNSLREWASDGFAMVQPIRVDQTEGEQMLVYGASSSTPEVLREDGSREALTVPEWTDEESSFGNDYGFEVLYSDRLLDDEIFAVRGNRVLYLVNNKSGKTRKLYTSKLPVYGVAASPDNSRVALLTASEPGLTPFADLIVLDRNGREVYGKPKASYISHSDGFLVVYPMVWTDEHNIAVPLIGNEKYGNGGVDMIDIDAEEAVFLEKRTLSEEELRLLEPFAGKPEFPNELRILPEPGKETDNYAVEMANGDIWLLNKTPGQVVKLGNGMLLKWTNEGNVLLLESEPEQPAYYIGLDGF
ncbi:hypothetical protein [Cohnella lupini]|uniref:Lipoprotein n=1 Tax=Cohnella lupini TaxID=1294267 RepID=A0A3D9I3I8_9BACL|nr:hypothetical protein [Cohnella lupini]RED55716.1 hypothetical protein DFP95_11642 [Cohnella lupini]